MPCSHPIDINIGQKIKELRLAKGMTQDELGKKIGVTFQQVQKYEKAINRITASKLWDLAEKLDVTIGYFFSQCDINHNVPQKASGALHEQESSFAYNHFPESKEILVLVRGYASIKDKKKRSAIYSLIKSLIIE